MRIVAVEQRHAARRDTFENFRLCAGNVGRILEEAQMRRRDQRHDRDMRPNQLRQRPDLTRMVHADLEDAR